ncbi:MULTISPECIES: hypothetical protein [unclassified Pseudomonas]|uniref:hypothetical protein n=1 Tax=unclassified Pseudomonas TaxID=196821 RepID=UPI0015A4BBFA|nr:MULTISPECIES: hypothetical protein [unclassified Pseudomonas]NWC95294.1 hypothetical protein [Pseudomonas sp. IPO3779]NWD17106.1 hypothetical protein [Pseudomonas sp. IPO3778]
MLLLRTLVLEQSGHDAPVNGALLCGFAVAQVASNFLAYSLDEETEPGSSRVYIATLRKKSERYFLGAIESKEDLQIATHVFKQILTLAAAPGAKSASTGETQIPYHFVDLKGCKLPPARPEDHHSLTIKKSLVMKVITLGTSAPGLPAIESSSLIVPSIRFSSRMVSPPRSQDPSEPAPPLPETLPVAPMDTVETAEPRVELPPRAPVEAPVVAAPPPPASKQQEPAPPATLVRQDPPSLFEVDDTLANLSRVAQELTQQKLAVLKQEEALEQMRLELRQETLDIAQESQRSAERMAEKEASLAVLAHTLATREEELADGSALNRAEQRRIEERVRYLESQEAQLHSRDLQVRHKEHQLAAALFQLPVLRDNLKVALQTLDESLAWLSEAGRSQSQPESRLLQSDTD